MADRERKEGARIFLQAITKVQAGKGQTMTAKTMTEVLAENLDQVFTAEYGDALAFTGDAEELAELLSAAGFGLVADAKAEALEEAAKDLDWVKPESACEDTEACCGSAASCDAMRPSSYVVGPAWLRKRAANLRAAS